MLYSVELRSHCIFTFAMSYQRSSSKVSPSCLSSGYQDSNLGPPAPKAGALTGLRYTPRSSPKGLLHSRLASVCYFSFSGCKGREFLNTLQIFSSLFLKKVEFTPFLPLFGRSQNTIYNVRIANLVIPLDKIVYQAHQSI